jgi:hypothetical protein
MILVISVASCRLALLSLPHPLSQPLIHPEGHTFTISIYYMMNSAGSRKSHSCFNMLFHHKSYEYVCKQLGTGSRMHHRRREVGEMLHHCGRAERKG